MTAKQECISLDCPDKWKQTLRSIDHAFGHTWEHCYAMYLTTGLNTYLYSFENENVKVTCPFAEREYNGHIDIVKPFGFSGFIVNGDCSEFLPYWHGFVTERSYVCGYLGFNPIFDCSHHFDTEEVCQYDTIFVLDLTLGIDELLADMETERRRRLRKRQRNDINADLVFEDSVLETFFRKHIYDFLRSKGASSEYFFSEDTLSYLFDLDNVKLVGAEDSGQIVAVMMLAYNSQMGDILSLVSIPEGRRYSAALFWYGVNYYKSLGVPFINLGGGGGSIADFKRRFGGKALPLKCLKQIYNPGVYEALCREGNVDFNGSNGYFPAYRKKRDRIAEAVY